MYEVETIEEHVDFWGVHSVRQDRPVFRGWAQSAEKAEAELERIKKSDGDEPEERYWIVRMTSSDLSTFKAMGTIPKDA